MSDNDIEARIEALIDGELTAAEIEALEEAARGVGLASEGGIERMKTHLVTLTNTESWEAVKLKIPAHDEAHALHRALLVEKDLYPDHQHHMVTISIDKANPSAPTAEFEAIEEKQVRVLERIDEHLKSPLLEM